jgi:hypothetical protein
MRATPEVMSISTVTKWLSVISFWQHAVTEFLVKENNPIADIYG